MASPQTQSTKPENQKPANGGAKPDAAAAAAPAAEPPKPERAARGSKVLTPLGYVNAVESARKRATGIEERLLKQVPEERREIARMMLKANDGK